MVAKFLVLVALVALSNASTFTEFRQSHGKTYTSLPELKQREIIFSQNLKKIEEHNARYEQGLETYTMGINQFSDMTDEEFSSQNHGLPKLTEKMANDFAAKSQPLKAKSALPASFSWRDTKGVVTSVKNQGQCGSCAAFAVTASSESCFNIKKSQNVADDLSEQFLVDCAYNHQYSDSTGNWIAQGCSGAWPQSYFDWIVTEADGTFQTEEAYPYKAHDNQCNPRDNGDFEGAAVTGQEYYWNSKHSDDFEANLMRLVVETGPVATTFEVTSKFGSFGGNGVFQDSQCCSSGSAGCTNRNNHAVTVVGYGHESGMDFWEVKNSWGGGWGDSGFFKIVRGESHCGFAAQMFTVAKC